jgi:hypothetical protein
MRVLPTPSIRRAWATLGLFCFALAAPSCGPGFKTVLVSGKVFVNGEPLTGAEATVVFRPDASKGNNLNFDFSGTVDESGSYTLYYGGKGNQGVAPGWYKVAVVATEPIVFPKPDKKSKVRQMAMPYRKPLIDKKYTVPTQSGIEIEVVEKPAPGAYDLNLTGPSNK